MKMPLITSVLLLGLVTTVTADHSATSTGSALSKMEATLKHHGCTCDIEKDEASDSSCREYVMKHADYDAIKAVYEAVCEKNSDTSVASTTKRAM